MLALAASRRALVRAAAHVRLAGPAAVARRSFADFPDHEILPMPALSPTMEQGNIASWVLKVGDEVIPGNAVAEIETDKASVAFEAQDEGYIAALLHPEGAQDIAVGTPIAVVVEEQGDVAAFANFTLADAGGDVPAPAPPAAAAPAAAEVTPAAAAPPAPPPIPVVAAAAVPVAAAAAAPAAAASLVADDLDGQPSWRSQVMQTSPLAALMLAEQRAYEERFGFTAMQPLERAAQEEGEGAAAGPCCGV